MCQIIALKTTKAKFKKIEKDCGILDALEDILRDKGGDYYSYTVMTRGGQTTKSEESFEDIIISIKKYLKKHNTPKNESIQILLFSRQRPEMESTIVQEQPYAHSIMGMRFSVHGTIHNDRELAKIYDVEDKVVADTEILQYMPVEDWHLAEGSFVVLGIDESGLPLKYEHGLKLWSANITSCKSNLANMISTTNVNHFNPSAMDLNEDDLDESRILMASFSSGMDIGVSVYKALKSGVYNKAVLNYFEWGSKAEEGEINQLEKFRDFYTFQFPDIDIEIKILDAEFYFDDYFKISGAAFPKISLHNNEASADSKETEAPLAYVPYRNSQFALLLASISESSNMHNVDIILGLNLSEGMVFMDNSEGWLEAISGMVKYGGKDPKISGKYKVVSPYFMRTKTNMLKEFQLDYGKSILNKILSLSTSCYYPDIEGYPCGECGSCILRKKAIQNKENDYE